MKKTKTFLIYAYTNRQTGCAIIRVANLRLCSFCCGILATKTILQSIIIKQNCKASSYIVGLCTFLNVDPG